MYNNDNKIIAQSHKKANIMSNPFYLQELPVDAPFCNRVEELKELQSYAEAKANIVLFSSRVMAKRLLSDVFKKDFQIRGPLPSLLIFLALLL